MSDMYTSKYPKILIDTNTNSVNDSMLQKITVEQYYDLLHHTHDISSISIGEGSMSYAELQSMVIALKEELDSLKSIVGNTDEIKNSIDELNKQMAKVPTVSDWDTETPGVQDANGNDVIGEILGFDMKEL